MAVIARINTVVETGIVVTGVAAVGPDNVDNTDGKTLLVIRNGSGGSLTVTVTPQATAFISDQLGNITKTPVAVAVAAGAMTIMGPFPPGVFNNGSGQLVITYSGVTSLTIAAIKAPN